MGRKPKSELDPETLQMLSLQEQGLDEEEIAKKFGLHRTTVSRRISALKKKINKTTKIAVRSAENSGFEINVDKPIRGLVIPKTNPFDVLTDFNDIARTSVTAGAIPGSAVAYIVSGFNDDGTKTVEERGTSVIKGFSILGGFLFGLVETSKSLTQESEKRKMKLVPQDGEE